MAVSATLFLVVALCVFCHGQGIKTVLPVRVITTVFVTIIITAASYHLMPDWRLSVIIAASTAWAFCFGPEIGWHKGVMSTQMIKAAWLTAPIFPFGLPYILLRPFGYWFGYTKFADQFWPDVVARIISGLSLGACVALAF